MCIRDRYEEERLGKNSFGSTKSGIAPFYSDKYAKIEMCIRDRFTEWVKDLSPDHAGMLLWECEKKRKEKEMPQTIKEVERLVELEEIREEYRLVLRKEILDFYTLHPNDKGIYEYLKNMDYEAFVPADKKELLEI